ncbi:GNAT family N-acetyltransferase [Thioclava sp. GXIMD4216]|uniref:GNAT family N-acetyltransferase n=1 Tax=Thioclava sp. GXIMD4216 TaxID=3131929 RepID=UPI0030D0957A
MRTCEEVTDLTDVHALRRAVFIEEQGYSEAEEFDGRDGEAMQILMREGDQPIATARVFIEGETAKIGRICVAKSHRGLGLGAEILRDAMARAKAKGCTKAMLSAQVQAIPFYEKLGYTAYGETYPDGHVPHRDMVAPL